MMIAQKMFWVATMAVVVNSAPARACGPDFPAHRLANRAATMSGFPDGTFAAELFDIVPNAADIATPPACAGVDDEVFCIGEEARTFIYRDTNRAIELYALQAVRERPAVDVSDRGCRTAGETSGGASLLQVGYELSRLPDL
jgi:hypothetical protein